MIGELKVEKLNGWFDYEFDFHSDLNLFTGNIGTGKTTLLKLIWFLTSGNLHRVISEIPFEFVSIRTSEFSLSMKVRSNPDQVECVWKFDRETEKSEVLPLRSVQREFSKSVILEEENSVRELNGKTAEAMQSSLFFPTFRRMERHFGWDILGKPLSQLANELSIGDHKLIAAVSTYDISDLLRKKKNEITNGKNVIDFEYETLVERWEYLDALVKEIYEPYYDGIRITDDIVLGVDKGEAGNYIHLTDTIKAGNIIPSANLSSGEKQLLGFLCYNAFSDAERIFIDEPELSLHPDWQRLIIPMLSYQGTEKQFFMASHSPFIGRRYEDNEFHLTRITRRPS